MAKSLLDDAFKHHIWATLQLVDACLALSADQLATAVPATDRSILATLQHIIGGDSFELFVASGERVPFTSAEALGLLELRNATVVLGAGWSRLLSEGVDAATATIEVDPDDGFRRSAPMGIRLAQALHHGCDHRAQICTALSLLGVRPPALDAFSFGVHAGRVTELYPGT